MVKDSALASWRPCWVWQGTSSKPVRQNGTRTKPNNRVTARPRDRAPWWPRSLCWSKLTSRAPTSPRPPVAGVGEVNKSGTANTALKIRLSLMR